MKSLHTQLFFLTCIYFLSQLLLFLQLCAYQLEIILAPWFQLICSSFPCRCFLMSSKCLTSYAKINLDRFISHETSLISITTTHTAWLLCVHTHVSANRVKGSSCSRNLKRLKGEWWEEKSITCFVSAAKEMLGSIFSLCCVCLTWTARQWREGTQHQP